jgi:hypothetical protein
MTQLSLQERLLRYLVKNNGIWIPKGEMADLAREKMGATGESVGRRLRVLAEVSDMTLFVASRTSPEHVRALELLQGGVVEVEHRERKHCWYRYVPPETKIVKEVIFEDGRAIEFTKTVCTK